MNSSLRAFALSLVCTLPGTFVAASIAKNSGTDYEKISSMARLPHPITFNKDGAKGDFDFDSSKWKVEKEEDGTHLFTHKAKPEARAAALKSDKGELESLTTFQLSANAVSTKDTKTQKSSSSLLADDNQAEDSTSLFFKEGKLIAFTQCEDKSDKSDKSAVGRICVTATPKLCQSLKAGGNLEEATIKEMDSFEMRALALLSTLRGADHQLDNLARSGNRLGLKSALQTTKGQLFALAKQVQKEVAPKHPSRDAASEAPKADAAKAGEKKDDVARTREILEKSVPRLRQACIDTGFVG